MTDATLLAQPAAEWQRWVRAALEAYREGDGLQLAQSPLAESALVEACFLDGEPRTLAARERALAAVLAWGVEKLQPGGAHSWTAQRWRNYNLLYYFYLQGMHVAELAEHLGVVEQTTYEARPAAWAALTTVLQHEAHQPQDSAGRKGHYLAARYAERSAVEQRLLRAAAIFRQPAPVDLATRLAALDASDAWSDLLAAHLLISDDERLTLLAHPELRPYLLTLLAPTERHIWHSAAAEHYQDHGDYLEAALHFRQVDAHEKAARILIEHAAWFQARHRAQLSDLLRDFRPAEVAPNTWAQLKLLSGNVAEALQDTDTALAEYGQALIAEDITIKAEAHYRRARIFKLRNAAEALAHYEACLRLLETARPEHPLLVQAALDAAWVYMEDYRDLAQAERYLQQAQTHTRADARAGDCTDDCHLAARLRNAWGEWWYLRGDLERSLAELYQARLAALEASDVEMQLNAAYNLGIRYAESGKLAEALGYLQEGRALAIQVNDRQREGRCDKGIGEYYFWLHDYGEAARYYEAAYTIFKAMCNPSWQAAACYDLAEALAELADWETARRYFNEGVALAEALTVDRHRMGLQALAARYPRLVGDALSERQTQILAYLHEQGALTSQSCAQMLGLSKEQALRELRALLAQGLVTTHGKGPATRYTLP
jgi:hypothetical protein